MSVLVMSYPAEIDFVGDSSVIFSTGPSSLVCLRAPSFPASALIDANVLEEYYMQIRSSLFHKSNQDYFPFVQLRQPPESRPGCFSATSAGKSGTSGTAVS